MIDILNTLILILLLFDGFLLLVFGLKKLSLLKKQKDLLREIEREKVRLSRAVSDREEEDDAEGR
ncbi:hypothetical protein PEPNEM18_01054 [Aedoeadaptatus nemausensis]|uniref:Uncharacterized protein n=1 Tax=Aedoeadaptatus nemausensis TaxID=2582829 RepID=A0A6V6Y4E0_9FIRM|nr:hypothetical protein [Peptoniphilus nemausensis]CAC9931710.1 hypothetical protein PEPNEM18_01054 [Peptoniphilus nemausensis]